GTRSASGTLRLSCIRDECLCHQDGFHPRRRRCRRRAHGRTARALSSGGGGESLTMARSGAIALGMRQMGMPVRPSAMEELQAASAVGQGPLYDVYAGMLAEHGVRSAQLLLTFFDISARMQYLNARRTLSKLLEWGVVPVVNENDTTSTDEISFGD